MIKPEGVLDGVMVGSAEAVWLGAGLFASRVTGIAGWGRIDEEKIRGWQADKTIPRKANKNPDLIRPIGIPDKLWREVLRKIILL